jgi:hypothetical protein
MLRTYLQPDMKSVLARDPVVGSSFDLEDPFWIDAESETFDRLLDLTRNSSGLWLTPEMEFAGAELTGVEHYEIVCRKTLKETALDYSVNIASLNATDFIATGGGERIKIMQQIALSKIDLKPNMVGGLDEWAEEYVVTDVVAGVFRKCGLSGFEARPVFNPKAREYHRNYFQLYAENVLPPAVRDVSVMEIESGLAEEKQLRQLGCLTYEPGGYEAFKDFNRTAEAWSSNDLPLWVVSKRVVQCFRQSKLKGWAFRAVLDKKSDLYAEYIDKWMILRQKISINPRNSF